MRGRRLASDEKTRRRSFKIKFEPIFSRNSFWDSKFDPDTESHHYLRCLKCDRIIDFRHRDYDALKIPDRIRNRYKVFNKIVVLEGLCAKCKKK